PPSIVHFTVTTPSGQLYVTANESLTISFALSEPANVSLTCMDTFPVDLPNAMSSATSFSTSMHPLTDWINTELNFTLRATDKSGNQLTAVIPTGIWVTGQ